MVVAVLEAPEIVEWVVQVPPSLLYCNKLPFKVDARSEPKLQVDPPATITLLTVEDVAKLACIQDSPV